MIYKNREWYQNLPRSKLSPPNWVFGVVWPILYLLMTISVILVWKNPKCFPFCPPLVYFGLQLVLNLSWTTLFFKYHLVGWSLLSLIIMVLITSVTIVKFYPISRLAAGLLVPYLVWLIFASYLTGFIVYRLK